MNRKRKRVIDPETGEIVIKRFSSKLRPGRGHSSNR